MKASQLQKVINDYRNEKAMLDFNLKEIEYYKKALKSRLKLVTRKIVILNDKLKTTPQDEEINFSTHDFDNLDILM